MNGHLSEEELILHHYGEAEDAAGAEAHLALCEACRASRDALFADLRTLNDDAVPERGEDYGAAVWARVAPQLGKPPRLLAFQARRWLAPVAMAASLLFAFLLGRQLQPPQPGPSPAPREVVREVVRERILVVAVGDHLEKSRMVLLELSHAGDEAKKVDISAEQTWAENLLANNRLYRQTAVRAGEHKVASVLDDLERLLVEVASGPSELTHEEAQAMRKRIEAGGLLFKVKVLGSQMRERERAVPRETPKAIS